MKDCFSKNRIDIPEEVEKKPFSDDVTDINAPPKKGFWGLFS